MPSRRPHPRRRSGLGWLVAASLGLATSVVALPAAADAGDGALIVVVDVDVDGDGEYSAPTDVPQPGIEVAVSDAGGTSVRGVTDEVGRFTLEPGGRLTGGRYFVVATVPAWLPDLTPVPASQTYAAFSTSVDVSLGPQTVRMGVAQRALRSRVVVPATPGPALTTPAPAAPAPRYAMGDLVWKDLNASGTQDPGEPGVPGVAVQLLDRDARLVASTLTSATGRYTFDRVPEGTYAVRFAGLPPGYKLEAAGAGGDPGADSDPDASGLTAPFVLGPEDPGLRATVPEDRLRATRFDPGVDAGLVPLTFALTSRVWLDHNRDGVRQPDEPPATATVSLLTPGGAVLASAPTDGQGRYLFSGLEAGRYRLRFDGIGPHRSFTVRSSTGGGDSAVSPEGTTAVFTLGQNARQLAPADTLGVTGADFVNASLGAGLVESFSLGDTVWRDHNGDGVRAPGDEGVGGVRVSLLDEAGRVLARETTTRTGAYDFEGLAAGVYRIRATGWSSGLVVTGRHCGADRLLDSDAASDGRSDPVLLSEENPADPGVDVGLRSRHRASAELGAVAAAATPPGGPVDDHAVATGSTSLPLAFLVGGLGLLTGAAIVLTRRLRRGSRD
ncbi:MAG: Carboxypeptidase regulatory-like protein [Friedmanniella sp.]|nr:Carboxypeptidase regulatory-like protein [Friedmanniella sp.]